jgi:hypothetical protein
MALLGFVFILCEFKSKIVFSKQNKGSKTYE